LVPVPIQTKIRVTEHLEPVQLPGDSVNIAALFECNELNQVILKELKEAKSKRVQSDFTFNSGQLKYSATTKPDTVYIHGKDSIVEREVPIRVDVPGPTEYINKLTWWQSTQIKVGRILFFIVLAFGLFMLLKWKLKF
jgi:hypothetical protein